MKEDSSISTMTTNMSVDKFFEYLLSIDTGEAVLIDEDKLPEGFWDLKTKIAGNLLQKCITYNVKINILYTKSNYTSNSLADFIYEVNKQDNIKFITKD